MMIRRKPVAYQSLQDGGDMPLAETSTNLGEHASKRPTSRWALLPAQHQTPQSLENGTQAGKKKTMWKATTDDLQAMRWRTFFLNIYRFVLPVMFMLGLAVTIFFMSNIKRLRMGSSLCLPDGTVNTGTSPYNPWNSSEIFTVNMGFGKLPFWQAKLIDVVWDLVCGRGGQALLAITSHNTFTSAISRLMESQSVSCGTFEAVRLQANSLKATLKLTRDFMKNKTARAKLIIVGLLLSAVITLVFPTLASAMTGYSANFDTQIKLPNGTVVAAKTFQKVWYIIHDGHRLGTGYHDGYPVVDLGDTEPGRYTNSPLIDRHMGGLTVKEWEDSRPQWMGDCAKYAPGKSNATFDITIQWIKDYNGKSECALLWQVSQYTHTYGLLGENKTASNFTNSSEGTYIPLEAPVLNISMYLPKPLLTHNHILSHFFWSYDLAWAVIPFGSSWLNSSGYKSSTLADSKWMFWDTVALISPNDTFTSEDPITYSNVLMNMDEILGNASCRQQGPGTQSAIRYQWGFSFQPLLMFQSLILVYTIIDYAIHFDVYMGSRLTMRHRSMGLRRAVLDIAPVYQEQLTDEHTVLTDDEKLRKATRGGMITYSDIISVDEIATRSERLSTWWTEFNFRKWTRQEWPYLTISCVWMVLTDLSLSASAHWILYVCDPYTGGLMLLGTWFTLMLGHKHSGRWVVFVGFSLLYVAAHVMWMVAPKWY